MTTDLRAIALALGGEVSGRQVLAPGPGHSHRDRSLSIRLSAQSLTGYVVFSHAGDDFAECRDYVAQRLGLGYDAWRLPADAPVRPPSPRQDDDAVRIARAAAIWAEGVDPAGTLVEQYLRSRGIVLPERSDAIRFHPCLPWKDEGSDTTLRVPCMVAAMRSIRTDELRAVHRTRLNDMAEKVDRRMLGLAAGTAVKIDADDAVTVGLAIGEGIETCLAGRQLGFRPTWALASAGAVASFPVLSGVETLTVFVEHDAASRRAVDECGHRWHRAGHEMFLVEPKAGNDVNDAIKGSA